MRLLSTLPLVLAATNTNTVVQASAPGNQQLRRRQTTLACDETYGEGFVRCGGPESEYCYNPSYGQVCGCGQMQLVVPMLTCAGRLAASPSSASAMWDTSARPSVDSAALMYDGFRDEWEQRG